MNFLCDPSDHSRQEAPPRVEAVVLQAFRRHHRLRRLRRTVLAVAATGAAAACVLVFLRTPVPVGRPAAILVHAAPPQIAWVKARPAPPRAVQSVRKAPLNPRQDLLADMQFMPLPYGDGSLVNQGATIVRIELPRSALRLAGFNVAQERASDRIEADVVLGPDGLAHAVRFVEY